VLVDFDDRPDLSERLRVRGLPYSVVLTHTGDVALPIAGFVSPQNLLSLD
jgi:thioredoxin-like negative regulator of GroEL